MSYLIEAMDAADWEGVRAVYLEGIATGHATFETDAPPSWQEWEAQSGPNRTDFRRIACGERQGDTPEAASSCILSQTLSSTLANQAAWQSALIKYC